MRQALHIFRKDLEHLRYDLLVVFALVALFTAGNVRQAHEWWLDRTVGQDYTPLLPLITGAWAYLLARAIQSEALPGDRQLWLTRPYSRASLLGSKILFAILLVNLPMLISDMVTLRANGFSPASYIAGLAWKQVLFTMMIVLPPFAFASMTRRLGDLILTGLGLGVVVLIEIIYTQGFAYGGGVRWPLSDTWIQGTRLFAVLAAAAIAIIALQYFRRSTLISRGIAAAVAALVWTAWILPPSRAELAMEPRGAQPIKDTSWLHVEFRHCEKCVESIRQNDDFARIVLPLELTGVPDGTSAEIASVTGYAFSPSGTTRLINDVGQNDVGQAGGGAGQNRNVTIHVSYYTGIRNQPVTFKLDLHFRIYKRRAGPMALSETPSQVPGIGYCAELSGSVICRAPLRWPPTLITARTGPVAVKFDPYFSASPFPTDSPITVVSSYISRPPFESAGIDTSSTVFDFAEPAMTVERSLEWKNIRLADFEK